MTAVILSEDQTHTTPGIHAFLGLATLPRFQTQANPLRLLPREIIDRIARFAHRDSYLAYWAMTGPAEDAPTEMDISRLVDEADTCQGSEASSARLHMARPLRSGVHYVEVTTTSAGYGTRLMFDGMGPWGYNFGIQLDCDIRAEEGSRCACFIHSYEESGDCLQVKSFGANSWTWNKDPVVFGVLVDMVRGCVTYRLNGLDGPCMKFPDYVRKARISVDRLPVAGDRAVPLVISCATPPIPSSLRAAAANPLTAKEHIAAGSLEDVSDEIDLDYHDNENGVDNVNDY